MLAPTNKQLENLMYLRDVVIPHMRQPGTLVHFDYVQASGTEINEDHDSSQFAECGTYRCFGGWYLFLRGISYRGVLHAFDILGDEFGISGDAIDDLLEDFEIAGDLDQIIAEKVRELA